ncbi:Gfo/Idh/MocA family oxidoreductase [Olsenella sp. HMSC062G07]|uniref:Gfo/Idh/MocA family oxidoreductase n=1 Tax=Olsenella sp. HMSC062G07 TaxID=1739330 RepID=UPI0008A41B09|nr:Gfo/Idh/MocA family oxidoreductase [Olsenella sp. HMSC062G07]OFK23260.1 hypothetical protein HMPREF2826_05660 [Olsenella sp. HMSC062G07]
MADDLGACLIGCGRAGLVHARDCNGRVREARLVVLCDPFEGGLAAARKELGVANTYTDYREAIVDAAVDATSVETVTAARPRRGRSRMRAHRRPGALEPRDVVA